MGDELGMTAAAEPLAVDLDRLIGTHLCVVANSGGGKSGAIRRLLEATHGRVLQLVLDVEDEFYTLRQRYDYVIAGGDGGDAPATPTNAGQLATAALEHGFSLIAQINDLGADGAPEFVGAFLTSLMQAPRALWRPVLVVVDETQRFAPRLGETAATAGVKDLLARGRKRGFTGVLASQSLPEIDPRVRGLVNNWLLGRAGTALDRKTVAAELGFAPSAAEAKALGGLQRQFWGYGPAISPEPVLIRVADVETPMPKPGDAKVPTPPPAGALKGILAGLATPSRAQETGTPPAERRASADEIAQADRAGYERGRAEGERSGEAKGVAAGIALARRALDAIQESGAPPVTAPDPRSKAPPLASPARSASTPGGARPGPQQRILNALAWWAAFGIAQPTNEQAAFVAGYSPTSTGYTNPRSALVTAGLITYPARGLVELTAAGRDAAASPVVAPTREEMHSRIWEKLNGPQQRILAPVMDAYPEPLPNAAVAGAAGYSPTSTGYTNPRSSLRTLNLIEYPARDQVRAADWLFPELASAR